MYKVFIDGSAGTTGLRIFERLSAREDITVLTIPEEVRKDACAKAEISNSADAVILCLPDAAAKEAVELITNPHTKIIDCSTAHRTASGWAYGFSELSAEHLEKIKISRNITNPGCHATGCCAILYPIINKNVISDNYPAILHSLTGYSGGGKKMIAEYEVCDRAEIYDSPAEYALSASHKHLPEIQKICGLCNTPALNPIVCDFYSGMVVCLPLITRLAEKKLSAREIRDIYAQYYEGSKLISVMPYNENGVEGGRIYSNTLSGTDKLEIIVCGNEETVNIYARFCNLGKGASGAAVQNLNISLGIPETKGLII